MILGFFKSVLQFIYFFEIHLAFSLELNPYKSVTWQIHFFYYILELALALEETCSLICLGLFCWEIRARFCSACLCLLLPGRVPRRMVLERSRHVNVYVISHPTEYRVEWAWGKSRELVLQSSDPGCSWKAGWGLERHASGPCSDPRHAAGLIN